MAHKGQDCILNSICELIIDCEHKTAPYQEEGYPSIRTPNIGRGRLILGGVNRVSEETYKLWTQRATPRSGDLILAREAPVGNVAVIPKNLQVCLGQRTVLIRPDRSKVDPNFLVYLLLGDEVQGKIHSLSGGATVAHLNMGEIRKLKLPHLPPLSIQQKIAAILSAYDDLIENNTRRIKILEEMAQAIYREWFVHFRFPGHEGVRMVDSELELVPEGWEIVKVSKICEKITSGGTPSTKIEKFWNGDIPWLSSGETRNHFILATDNTITPEGVANSSTRFIEAGTTIVASAGQGHTRGQTSFMMIDSYINQSIVALIANQQIISNLFLYFEISLRYDELRNLSDSNSSRGSLTTRLLGDLDVIVPPKHLIDDFDKIASNIVNSIAIRLLQNSNLRRTRDLLLPKLISGEIDVSALDIKIPAT